MRRVPFDGLYNSCKNGRLSAAPCLVARHRPVPAGRRISEGSLLWIDDDKLMGISQFIHLGSSGKDRRRLGAAMQHDDKRYRCPWMIVVRCIDKVRATACLAMVDELLPGSSPGMDELGSRTQEQEGERSSTCYEKSSKSVHVSRETTPNCGKA